jgi:hypothetical protein
MQVVRQKRGDCKLKDHDRPRLCAIAHKADGDSQIQISNSLLWRRRPARPGDPVFQKRFVLLRDVTAYWMPRLKRGMTIEERSHTFSRRDASELCD